MRATATIQVTSADQAAARFRIIEMEMRHVVVEVQVMMRTQTMLARVMLHVAIAGLAAAYHWRLAKVMLHEVLDVQVVLHTQTMKVIVHQASVSQVVMHNQTNAKRAMKSHDPHSPKSIAEIKAN